MLRNSGPESACLETLSLHLITQSRLTPSKFVVFIYSYSHVFPCVPQDILPSGAAVQKHRL